MGLALLNRTKKVTEKLQNGNKRLQNGYKLLQNGYKSLQSGYKNAQKLQISNKNSRKVTKK